MKLRTLPPKLNLKNKRVLVRVDWNVPVDEGVQPEGTLKIERSLATFKELTKRGAIVIVLTHLGRPKDRESKFSTRQLATWLGKQHHLPITFHPESVSRNADRLKLVQKIQAAPSGSIHLLENVRFEKGEESNSRSLAKAYASLGDLFLNDAFASSHRAHVSVVGITRVLPAYAGPSLLMEVNILDRLLHRPKRPFVAVIGGLKLSTKVPVLQSLLKMCDRVLIGGAMATTFFASQGIRVGKSFVEPAALATAKKLLARSQKIVLPRDAIVTGKIEPHPEWHQVRIAEIESNDIIADIGKATLEAWGKEIQKAKTILWNGPVGVTEIPEFSRGSAQLARLIAARAEGSAFGVAGGGDTIPVLFSTRTQKRFDFVSTGGGALLEFLAKKGKLPGLVSLLKK